MTSRQRRHRWRLAAASAVVAIAALAAAGYGIRSASIRRGAALFTGKLPLVGRITGQTDPLPVGASRCSNCHTARTAGADRFAPQLDADFLGTPRSRRGGPPSRYDQQSFCRLIRSGVDPAYIIIPQEMPRYELADADCGSLWRYTLSR